MWYNVGCNALVWQAVPKALLPKGSGRDVYPRVQVNRRAVCLSARCVLVCCCTVGTSARSHWARAALPTPVHGRTGSTGLTALLGAVNCTALCALDQANQQHTASPPRGSGQWNSCNALPHCLWAVGIGTPAMHRHTACGQWAVELMQVWQAVVCCCVVWCGALMLWCGPRAHFPIVSWRALLCQSNGLMLCGVGRRSTARKLLGLSAGSPVPGCLFVCHQRFQPKSPGSP